MAREAVVRISGERARNEARTVRITQLASKPAKR